MGLDSASAQENLQIAGIEITDPEISIKDLAAHNDLSPHELFTLMKGKVGEPPSGPLPLPDSLPMGSGRKTLAGFCADYQLDLAKAVQILEQAGWQVDPGSTLREIAASNDEEALDLVDILRQGFELQGQIWEEVVNHGKACYSVFPIRQNMGPLIRLKSSGTSS